MFKCRCVFHSGIFIVYLRYRPLVMRHLAFLIYLTLVTVLAGASDTALTRAIYIDRLDHLIKDSVQTAELLSWLKRERFNTILLYDLEPVLDRKGGDKRLQTFIEQVRYFSGVEQVIAIGSTAAQYNRYCQYAKEHQRTFDYFQLELEWWVKPRKFEEFSTTVNQIYASEGTLPLVGYMGWFTGNEYYQDVQARFYTSMCRTIYVHLYQEKPHFSYAHRRLRLLAREANQQERQINLIFLLSAEPDFSAKLLERVSVDKVYEKLVHQMKKALNSDEFNAFKVYGYAVFNQTELRKVIP